MTPTRKATAEDSARVMNVNRFDMVRRSAAPKTAYRRAVRP
jgi:hypothetical protein